MFLQPVTNIMLYCIPFIMFRKHINYSLKARLFIHSKISNNMVNIMMSLCCMVLIALTIPIAKLLFAKEFFYAWQYAPNGHK